MSQTKRCTICVNAGMPPEVYTTHFVRETRDISSKVTCPILKNNICSKCGMKGHFAGSCKVVKREKVQAPMIRAAKVATTNNYDFGSESEEEVLPTKSDKDYSNMLTLGQWQNINKDLLLQPEDKRNTAKYYWDANYKLFCANGSIIYEKDVLCLGREETIKVFKSVKSSWADDEDD